MTLSGGGADKLGNRYEGLWTVLTALDLLDERVHAIGLERPGQDGEGVEFVLEMEDGREFHQVKRRSRDGWTLNRLDQEGVLSSFFGHLTDPRARCVFVSTHPADALANLSDRARKTASPTEFSQLFASGVQIDADFETLRALWGCTSEVAWERLQRVEIVTIDDRTLQKRLRAEIAPRIDGNAAQIWATLADYLVQRTHELVTAHELWLHLEQHGFRRRDWHNDPRVIGHVERMTAAFLKELEGATIGGHLIRRDETQRLVQELKAPDGQRCAVVSGEAGIGKSSVVIEVIDTFKSLGWPVLAFRVDRLNPTFSALEIGMQLGLPESPANVLVGIAQKRDALLVVDQLDAVSLASGRHPEFFELVLETVRQALDCPNLRVLIACRKFDLLYDDRFRKLVHPTRGLAVEIPVGRLSSVRLESALQALGLDPERFDQRQRTVLSVPLHLKLLTESLEPGGSSENFTSVSDLYRLFWEAKQRAIRLRLGRAVNWIGVIDAMCTWMSQHQSLSVPMRIIEYLGEDVQIMASEGVLVTSGVNAAFFHEGFFDYAYARRFATLEDGLLALLLGRPQHLFRRAQVRQVLVYLRDTEFAEYLANLEALLHDPKVRFHIRQSVYAVLASVQEPTKEEWQIVSTVLDRGSPSDTDEVWRLLRNSTAWFRLADRLGQVERWLASDDEARLNAATWMLAGAKEGEPSRVAELLEPFIGRSSEWNNRAVHVIQYGNVGLSRRFFEFFLHQVSAGLLDRADFWMILHELPQTHPEWACEAIGTYLHRQLERTAANPFERGSENHIPESHHDDKALKHCATQAPETFLEHVLPFVMTVAMRTAEAETRNGFFRDEVWAYRQFHDPYPNLSDVLLETTVTALCELAKRNGAAFRRHAAELRSSQLEVAQFILMRGFCCNPEVFADDAILFLCEAPARFRIGYMGNSERASHDLLKCATPHASEATMTELERTVLNYYPTWELNKGNAQARGQAQLKLLAGVADSRLTPAMRNRLQELRRKLPDLVPDDATVFFGGEVVSPIPKAAAERMSDAQWLKAMEKYSSDETRNWHPDHAIGGSSELSRVLAEETKRDPARFATLALSMPDSVHRDYFEAIVMGMGEAEADLASVLVVCQRCHALPGRPNGRWIARLIARHAERDLPEEALELVSWYALSDPDPAEESWRKTAVGGGTYYGGDILTAGLNTVRGSAGDAIGTLLFPKVERLSFFEPVLERMVDDPSIAVRSQVAKALIAVLKYDRDLAVRLFLRLCDTEEDLLGTYFVEQFLRYALTTHFDQLEPIVKRMLVSQNTQVGRVGARRACIAAFNNDRAQPLADQAMGGSQFLRLGAAEVYATNLGHGDLQRVCEAALHTLFQDDDDEVRKAAARCFGNLSDEDVERLGGLIQAFIESPAFDSDHHLLLHTLNEGSARVPDVVLSVCERFFTVSGEAARDIQRPAFGEAQIISELVARIYGQQLNASYQDSAMIDRCLDLIDEMCMLRIYGLEKLLEVQDR